MSVRPIIFSAPMVRALLDGRKTQTRRVVKFTDITQRETPTGALVNYYGDRRLGLELAGTTLVQPIPYAPGDLLWVREAFRGDEGYNALPPREWSRWPVSYEADPAEIRGLDTGRLRSPIHMPRWASRLTLRVTDVRVQRVQDISEADAQAEGVRRFGSEWSVEKDNGHGAGSNTAVGCFRLLWNSIHGPDAWAANPWVCALTFDVIRANVDEVQG